MNKFGAITKLYLLVAVLGIFIVGIGIYGIAGMNAMNQDTHTIYADRIFPMDQLGDIRFFYESILYRAQQCNYRKITIAEALNSIQQSEDSIHTNWEAYRLTYLTPEEKKLAGEADVLLKHSDAAIAQLKQVLLKNDTAALNQMINGGLYTAFNPAIHAITRLLQLQVQVSTGIYRNSRGNYISTLNRFVVLIIASFAFALMFSYFLVKNIKKLINELSSSNAGLKKAEEKYRSFIRYAGDMIYILDEDLAITEVNDSGCGLLGYKREELIGMKIPDLMLPEDMGSVSSVSDALKAQGRSLHERKWVRKNGTIVETEVSVRKIEGGYISVVRDIGERKKAECALRESEKKYRFLFDKNPAYIIVWDMETLEVLEVNDMVVQKYGYSREQFRKMTVLDYRLPQEHEKIRDFARQMLTNDEPFATHQWVHIDKNGAEMLMEISSHRIIYHNRKAILSLGSDVTEKVKTQQSLQKSEEKFRSLIDHAADGIFMVDDRGIIFDVNLSAAKMTGYSKEELIGMSVLNLHPEEIKSEVPQLWDSLRKQRTLTDERLLVRKNGTKVDVQISRSMLPDASGAIAIVHDITNRKKAENQLKQQNDKLLDIAFFQSHIVRRPAANIKGLVNLFNKSDQADPLNFELIQMLERATDELDEIISQIIKKAEEMEN